MFHSQFGELSITTRFELKDDWRHGYFRYVCSCGRRGRVQLAALRRGKRDCGAYIPHRVEPHVERPHPVCPGMRFERWLVLFRLGHLGAPAWFLCKCDCGEERAVRGNSLMQGVSRSCGCLTRESSARRIRERNLRHGMTGKPEFRAYCGARQRCLNPKSPRYSRYGGRGIEFRYASFQEFLADVGFRPSPQHSLDRKDNDGHYEVGNCRWATRSQQARNQRRVGRFALKKPAMPELTTLVSDTHQLSS